MGQCRPSPFSIENSQSMPWFIYLFTSRFGQVWRLLSRLHKVLKTADTYLSCVYSLLAKSGCGWWGCITHQPCLPQPLGTHPPPATHTKGGLSMFYYFFTYFTNFSLFNRSQTHQTTHCHQHSLFPSFKGCEACRTQPAKGGSWDMHEACKWDLTHTHTNQTHNTQSVGIACIKFGF
jgi:hypothetical protein